MNDRRAELAFLTRESRVAVAYVIRTPPIQTARGHKLRAAQFNTLKLIRSFEPISPILSDSAIKFNRFCDFLGEMTESTADAGPWKPREAHAIREKAYQHLPTFTGKVHGRRCGLCRAYVSDEKGTARIGKGPCRSHSESLHYHAPPNSGRD